MQVRLGFFRLYIIVCILLLGNVSCAQSPDEERISELVNKVSEQCSDLNYIGSNSFDWVVVRGGGMLLDLESLGDINAYLNLSMGEDSVFHGYYTEISKTTYLNFSLTKCDTAFYFFTQPMSNGVDTIFTRGFYKYLYDFNKLSLGQQRFYRQNADSLVSVRGNNLKALPELERQKSPSKPDFKFKDN